METIMVGRDELFGIMQHVNLVKVKFYNEAAWVIAPVLFSNEGCADVLVRKSMSGRNLDSVKEVDLKFQKFGYEYLVKGEITDLDSSDPSTITINFLNARKFYNVRKHVRFDANLKATLAESGSVPVHCFVKNISKGGALLVSDMHIEENSVLFSNIFFDSGKCFTALTRILRTTALNSNEFIYGVQFIDATENNYKIIDSEIAQLEREYLKSLNVFREHTGKSNSHHDTRIAILSYEADESYDIKEVLMKLGAPNFEIYRSTKFYGDIFAEEKPKLVIIDSDNFDDGLACTISDINKGFPDIRVILLLPLKYSGDGIEDRLPEVEMLYKPLIYNEFESAVIKYL